MYLDKDAILNSLTKEDIIKICALLGSPNYKEDSNGNLFFSTAICHGGDSPHKLAYYLDGSNTNAAGQHRPHFYCYTCQDSYDVVEQVIRANRLQGKTQTWYKALRWIGQVTGKQVTIDSEDIPQVQRITDFEWMNRIKAAQKNRRAVPSLNEINEHILEIFCYEPHELWLNEGITREALGRYEIGYYGLTNQIIIPHRDKDERLIGIRGRYLDKADVDTIGKYVPLQINGRFLAHQQGSNLYGINVTQDKIKRCHKAMLVEGEKSCLQAYSYFGDDSFVLATCGSSISKPQMKLLLQYLGVEEVIVGFDREYDEPDSWEAEAYYHKLIKRVAPLVPYCKVCLCQDNQHRLGLKDSPTDKGKEVLLELLEEKHIVTQNEVVNIQNGE